MKRTLFTIALIGLGATSASAFSWTNTPHIDRTQAQQEAQIRQGMKNGSITRAEGERLIAEQRRIQALENAAKRDGIATPAERQAIRNAQQQAARHIYQESHDAERRGFRRWFGWNRSHDIIGEGYRRRWAWWSR
jgi:hypothetical protein